MKHAFFHLLVCKLTIALLSTLLLASCSRKTDEIVIVMPEGPATVSFVHMMEKSQVLDNRKINYKIISDPAQIQSLILQKKADFAVLPTVMAANLYNKRADYHLLGIPVWGTLYILSRQQGVIAPEHLQGQPVHLFGQGATADVLFRCYLEKHGISGVELSYSLQTNQELAQALLHQKIQTAILSEPLVSIVLSKDSNIRIISRLTCEEMISIKSSDTFVQTAFLVNNSFRASYPDLTTGITDLYRQSCNEATSNPAATARLLTKYGFYTDLTTAEQSVKRCSIRYRDAGEIKQEIDAYLRIFYNFDPASIGGKMPDEAFISN